jgi:hypothetical protein
VCPTWQYEDGSTFRRALKRPCSYGWRDPLWLHLVLPTPPAIRSGDGTAGSVLMEVYEVPPRSTADPSVPANLEIRQFSVVSSSDGYFGFYSPRLQLVETTRRSATLIVSLTLKIDIPTHPWILPTSWTVEKPVIAGGSVFVLATDSHGSSTDGNQFGVEWWPRGVSGMTATITYRVSDGTERVVTASAPVIY